MSSTGVPPNDPKSPRWLLDLQKWEILPYTEVPKDILDLEGYGVVSYTWGYIINKGHPAPDPPRGLLWDVPGVKNWNLETAKKVMEKIGTRFIWWDWMCVPQQGEGMRELNDELHEAQRQEIGKQMHIYGKARNSIVWLHSTSWAQDSAVKTLLNVRSPEDDDPAPVEMNKLVDEVKENLKIAREKERWLHSGWTLQEGVLLHETVLLDGAGSTLPGDFWMANEATVSDLTVPITRLAYEVAIGYFIQTQGHEPDLGAQIPRTAHQLSKMPAMWLRQSLEALIGSGYVSYWEESPLYILAGKRSRKFGHPKDRCWALVGALGIDDVDVTYDKNVSMEEVKRRLLVSLINKYQWKMLLLPFPEFRVQEEKDEKEKDEKVIERDFKWIDVAGGSMLPVHAFCVEEDSGKNLSQENLPALSYTHDLRIKARNGEKITLYRASDDGAAWFRHYRQDKDGLKIVSSKETAWAEDRLLSGAWLLPLHRINMKVGVPGRRCLVVLGLDSQALKEQPVHAKFGGIVDIKSIGSENVQFDEVVLDPSL